MLGYPDMGNGKFSQQLTYAEWLEFNNVQRGELCISFRDSTRAHAPSPQVTRT